MSREKQFFDILKKYGITEYWCSREFDPSDEYPKDELLLPTNDPDPALSIIDLYTDEKDPEGYCSLFVLKSSKDSNNLSIQRDWREGQYHRRMLCDGRVIK